MTARIDPDLQPGKVYRTQDFKSWTGNPTRLAKRLVRDGQLRRMAQGLFYAPQLSRFGPVPPEDSEILRGFLGSDDFVITGPQKWNALGLGSTAVYPVTLVYNTKRSGDFLLGRRRFRLRRVRFPRTPEPEWYVVDLLEHHEMAGVSLSRVEERLITALDGHRFDPEMLRQTARSFATSETQDRIERAIRSAAALA